MACKLSIYLYIGIVFVVKAVIAEPTANAAPQPAAQPAPGPVAEAPVADPESELTPYNPNNRAGSSVKCYDCVNCEKVTSKQHPVHCPYSRDPRKTGKCVFYKMQISPNGGSYLTRGCASRLGTCQDLAKLTQSRNQALKLEFCNECAEDGCNSGTSLVASLVFLIVVPIVGSKILS